MFLYIRKKLFLYSPKLKFRVLLSAASRQTNKAYTRVQNFLRSARPAEAAIVKVFAKIPQKIWFCKFFRCAGRTGTSRITSWQNFSLERPLAVPKTSKKRKKKIYFFYDFGTQFFIIFDRFWRSYGQTDLKIRFSAKFCSRYSFPEVCTIKTHAKTIGRGGKSGNFLGLAVTLGKRPNKGNF